MVYVIAMFIRVCHLMQVISPHLEGLPIHMLPTNFDSLYSPVIGVKRIILTPQEGMIFIV